MPNIYAELNDGQVSKTVTTSWADARDATDGTASSLSTNSSLAIRAHHGSARGGGNQWSVHRSFFEFDTSGISEAPESANLQIYGRSGYTVDFFVVKSIQTGGSDNSGGNLVNGDFDAIVGWSAGADNSSNVTKYSSEVESWASGYQTIALNSTALSDMASLDVFKICLIDADYDLPNTAPSSTSVSVGVYFANYTGTTRDPLISYSTGAYGNKVGGVDGPAEVLGVADVEKVIGV